MPLATQTTTIRLATVEDLPQVVEMIVALRDETIWRTIEFQPDREYILIHLLWILRTDPAHILFVAESDGRLIGCCGGEVTTARFIPEVPYVREWAWYVEPLYRLSGVGAKLLRQLFAWGKQRGAKGAQLGRVTIRGEEQRWIPF